MATQKIRDAAASLSNPTCDSIRAAISEVMIGINDTELKYWSIGDQNRPIIELVECNI
jgi:hypothetical protein